MSRKDAIKKLHETLVRRRDAIRRALKGDLSLFQELHQEKTGDVLDAAADSVQDELNSQLIEVEARELNAIDEAIARMDQGMYGQCDGCGKSIPLTRLRAVPYATDCIECRRKSERKKSSGGVSWNRVYDQVDASQVDA
jgi:DnaK suppressor protein